MVNKTPFASEFSAYAQTLQAILSHPFLFVLAPPKSGKSTLADMLNTHRDVQILSECHFPNELLPHLRKSRSGYNKFVKGKRTASASELPLPSLGSKFDKFAFAAAMASAIESALGDNAPAIIGDTTPDNIIHINVLLETFADPRILHVVRDGRDAALASCRHQEYHYPKRFPKTFGTRDAYLARYVGNWRNYVLQTRALGAAGTVPYLEIDYADMIARPAAALAEVFNWLALDYEDTDIARAVESGPFQPSAEGYKLCDSPDVPGYSGWQPGLWKSELSDAQKEAFLKLASPLLTEDGLADRPTEKIGVADGNRTHDP